MRHTLLLGAGLVLLLARASFAYGPTGHEIVGGIADKLLAGTPAGAKVREHLYGYLIVFNTRTRNTALMQTRSALIRDGRVVYTLGFDR